MNAWRRLILSYHFLTCMYGLIRLQMRLQWMATRAGLKGIWS